MRHLGIVEPKIDAIAVQRGEKFRNALLSSEEMIKGDDQGDYLRVPLSARWLEYELHLEQGDHRSATLSDYTSGNTERLGVDAAREPLLLDS